MMADPIQFPTTSWAVVIGAIGHDARRSALQILCESYWPPVYAYLLRQVNDPEEAKDLTQSFFARLLEKRDWHPAKQQDGRFRWYLIACAKHFLANERDRSRAKKRGGGLVSMSLDLEVPGALSLIDEQGGKTPEQIFEKRWALLILERAVRAVKRQYDSSGQGSFFERLKTYLVEGSSEGGYRELARDLGTSEGAIRMAVHRIRRRFADALRAEIGLTVADPADVQDEIEYLLSVLRS
jgi:RNA polymerase sigma-70 factor (ECF subfamily)